ncbi:MAG: protein kinase domain-containing protein, partial [Pyrinomonadaceae bacterium]
MLHCPECGRQYQPELSACPEDGAALRADATVAIDVSVDPFIGRTLDAKYRLESRLGEGGMGTVYRATHLLIERAVAIKILNPRYVEDEAARERFRREARAAAGLQHPNVVSVFDRGTWEDTYYIAMELVEGSSLRDLINR